MGASHRDLKRVQELVERQPALARAAIDWGFGDWEACLDAASHTGNKGIADFLLTNGARPTIFSAAMMGQLDVEYLTGLGDADVSPPTVPLNVADRATLVGKYPYGPGSRDHFTIEVRRDMLGRDQLTIERTGAPSRQNLYHVGNLVFFPTGVPSAKIAFAKDGARITQLTVADPNVMMTARRTE